MYIITRPEIEHVIDCREMLDHDVHLLEVLWRASAHDEHYTGEAFLCNQIQTDLKRISDYLGSVKVNHCTPD